MANIASDFQLQQDQALTIIFQSFQFKCFSPALLSQWYVDIIIDAAV